MQLEPKEFNESQDQSPSLVEISTMLVKSLTLGIDYELPIPKNLHGSDQRKSTKDGQSIPSQALDLSENGGISPGASGPKSLSSSSIASSSASSSLAGDSSSQDYAKGVAQAQSKSPATTHTSLIDQVKVLDKKIQECQLCGLCLTRTNAVPGMGSYEPLVMVIGEAPGADEDRQGLPFVGKAGQYLDEWLRALGLSRQETVYITNVIKCRPPGNRDPHPEEIKSCSPYVENQIELLKPRVILSLGRFSAAFLLGGAHRMEDIHGKMFEYRGVPVFPTYHPAAVLRNQDLRRPVWEDLKQMHQFLYLQGLVSELPQKTRD